MNTPTKNYFIDLQRKLEAIKEEIETYQIEVAHISNEADDTIEFLDGEQRKIPSGQKLIKEVEAIEGLYESLKVCAESIGITLQTVKNIAL